MWRVICTLYCAKCTSILLHLLGLEVIWMVVVICLHALRRKFHFLDTSLTLISVPPSFFVEGVLRIKVVAMGELWCLRFLKTPTSGFLDRLQKYLKFLRKTFRVRVMLVLSARLSRNQKTLKLIRQWNNFWSTLD